VTEPRLTKVGEAIATPLMKLEQVIVIPLMKLE
jgi:hypothetical protein